MPTKRTILVLVLLAALGSPAPAEAGRSHQTRRIKKSSPRTLHARSSRGARRKPSRLRRWSRVQLRKIRRLVPHKVKVKGMGKGRGRITVEGKGKGKGKGKGRGRIRARVKTALGTLSRKLHIPQLKKSVGRKLCVARGYCTLAADRVEAALPKRLARGYGKLRLLSPGHLAAFTGQKFKGDPLFLSSFGVAYPVATHLQIPAYIAMGMNPVAAVVVHEALEIPLGLGILAWRQHHLRKDRSQTFRGTLRSLGREHSEFARSRQQESRRFMKQRARARQQGSLGQMGMALAGN